MINILIQYMLGPAGRALENAYLSHGLEASLIVMIWMAILTLGLRSVHHMRRLLHGWVKELLPQYNLDNFLISEEILRVLEPRWNEAASRMRFMPTKRGLWIQRATPDGLREPAGFTPNGIDQLITRLTGRHRDIKTTAIDAVVRPSRGRRRLYR